MKTLPILSLLVALPAGLPGQAISTSASYTLLTSPAGQSSGGSASSASFAAESSTALPSAGADATGSGGDIASMANFAGQLYEMVGLSLGADPPTVEEGSIRQLNASAILDDATLLPIEPSEVIWTENSDALTGITPLGVVTAATVYQDEPAIVNGSYLAFADPDGLALTVLNTSADDFGEYAGDGLGDDWQVTYFGSPPNPDAAPHENPDHDPSDNRLEFLTGYDPTDSGSFFTFAVTERNGIANTLELSKVVPGTRYRLERSNDLRVTDRWTEVDSFTTGEEVREFSLDDPAAPGPRWFYRVGVEPE